MSPDRSFFGCSAIFAMARPMDASFPAARVRIFLTAKSEIVELTGIVSVGIGKSVNWLHLQPCGMETVDGSTNLLTAESYGNVQQRRGP